MAAVVPAPYEIVEVVIHGWTYKIAKLGASQASDLLTRLLRLAGAGFDRQELDITKLTSALTGAELKYVQDLFVKVTRISPEDNPAIEFLLKDKFEAHFSGHMGAMMLWLKACLEANYANFLDEIGVAGIQLKSLLALAMAKSASPIESPPAGPSGDVRSKASEA